MRSTPSPHPRWLIPTPARSALLLFAAAMALPVAVLVQPPALRALFVLPLVLLVPGYGLLLAAFGPQLRLDPAPAAALSGLLSAALYPLLALVLYAVGVKLSPWNAVATTVALLLALAAVVSLRGRTDGRAGDVGVPAALPSRAEEGGSMWAGGRGGVLFFLAVAVVVGAVLLVLRALPDARPEPYSQFYLRGPWAQVNRVVKARPDHRLVVELGVANHSRGRQTYRVVPQLDRGQGWLPRQLELPAGGRWAGSVSGTVPSRGCLQRLAIALEKDAAPPERRLLTLERLAIALEKDAAPPERRLLTLWVRPAVAQARRCRRP